MELIKAQGFDATADEHRNLIRVDDALGKTSELNKKLVESGIGVSEIFAKNVSLEDYYLSLTGGGKDE